MNWTTFLLNRILLKYRLIIFILSLTFLGGSQLWAQGVDDEKDLPVDTTQIISVVSEADWDLFGNEEVMHLSLVFDVKNFLKPKNAGDYQDARLLIHVGETDTIERSIRIRTRGNFRQQYCYFPPIKLNLKKTSFDNEYLSQQTTLKFVTHCKNASQYESYILKEYLVYKLYNVLSEFSFNVRLIEMQYIDSEENRKTLVKYGFLIEHLNSVAARNDAMSIDNKKLSQKLMDPYGMARVALFNYMIGNTDWSIAGLHNMKVMKVNDFLVKDPQPVPYDFDHSGMVNTEYAAPTEGLGLESVRDRLYRGICLDKNVTDETIRLFLEKKMQIYDVIEDFELLSKYDKKDMIEYLDGFFRILDSNFLIQRDIYSNCIEY